MKKLIISVFTITAIAMLSFKSHAQNSVPKTSGSDTILFEGEKHFANMQQLTFGGDNAEAYFSYDGKWLIYQYTNAKEGITCDQMFIGKIPTKPGEKFEPKRISSGKGRTTCGFFTKDGKHVIYASTHLGADTCPPVPDRKKYGNKYIWPLYDSYDIFMADLDGKIVKEYKDFLGQNLVAPTNMEVFIADANGNNVKQVTSFGNANWAPSFMHDGKRIIFASNHQSKRGYPFNLYTINNDGTKLEKITAEKIFDAFAMFSPDGKKLVFCSNRNNRGTHDTNIFIADWVE